jgi:hypothetical protein
MRPVCLLLLLAAVAAGTAPISTNLVVCVHEGREFRPYLDRPRMSGDSLQNSVNLHDKGVDAFVSVMVGSTLKMTGLETMNDRTPVWNTCFTFDGVHDANTPVVFVGADGDMTDEDDIVGISCTTAKTGVRWLTLNGPDGHAAGRIRVQILHLKRDGVGDSMDAAALGWEGLYSATSEAPTSDGAVVEARLTCPAGKRPVACQCFAQGAPGCATARLEGDTCIATSAPYVAYVQEPPCPVQEGGIVFVDNGCTPPGWTLRPQEGVAASARCVKAEAFASMTDVVSAPTLDVPGDAVSTSCPPQSDLLGCSISSGDGDQVVLRYANLDTTAAEGDGVSLAPACIARVGTSGTPTRASARCGTLPESVGGPEDKLISIAMISKSGFGYGRTAGMVQVAQCPIPLQLVGCACYSPTRNCLGARFQEVRAADGSTIDVCAMSVAPPKKWTEAVGFGFANCMWRGPVSRLVTATDVPNQPTCAAATTSGEAQWVRDVRNVSLINKKWLPEGLAERLREQQKMEDDLMDIYDEEEMELIDTLSYLYFFLGVGVMLIVCCLSHLTCTRVLCTKLCEFFCPCCSRICCGVASPSTASRLADETGGPILGSQQDRDAPSDSILHRADGVEAVPLSARSLPWTDRVR